MAINILPSRCAGWLCVLYSGMSLSGSCGKLGVSGSGFWGVCVGGNTGGAMAKSRAYRQRGGRNKIVVASTRRWSVVGLGRVATLGSGELATLSCGVNKGGTLGGDIGDFGGRTNFEAAWTAVSLQGETIGKFGG